ncbi:MAG: NAD(P)-dependent oxidoreductase, partial [Solimonas sp.]
PPIADHPRSTTIELRSLKLRVLHFKFESAQFVHADAASRRGLIPALYGMKILVTGSSGRIGRAIVTRLMRSHEVIGLDRNPASVSSVIADLGDEQRLMESLCGVDAVIHTASLHAPHVPHVDEARFVDVNIKGTESIIRCCIANSVKNIIYTSTTALFGVAATPLDHAGWVTEDTAPVPQTIYHTTKIEAESLLRAASQSGTLHTTVIRMSRCFPEPAPIMAMYRLHRGIDARDVAVAHEKALLTNDSPFRVFIVSGNTPFQPEDTFQLKSNAPLIIRQRAPELAQAFESRGWNLPATIDRVYSNAKAQKELDWQPRFGFKSVLQQFDEESSEVLPPLASWGVQE